MIEILSPPVMNEIIRQRNIPYLMRNPRDLDSQLANTVYCGLEIIAYKRTIMATTTCENKEKQLLIELQAEH